MSSTAQKFAFCTSGKYETCSPLAHLESGVDQSIITFDDQPLEESVKDGSCNASNSHCGLIARLPLGHPLRPDLDPWLAERLDRVERVDQKCPESFARERLRAHLRL